MNFTPGQIYESPQGVREHIHDVTGDGKIVSGNMPLTIGVAANVQLRTATELEVILEASGYTLVG